MHLEQQTSHIILPAELKPEPRSFMAPLEFLSVLRKQIPSLPKFTDEESEVRVVGKLGTGQTLVVAAEMAAVAAQIHTAQKG